jgi:hypothetical protein
MVAQTSGIAKPGTIIAAGYHVNPSTGQITPNPTPTNPVTLQGVGTNNSGGTVYTYKTSEGKFFESPIAPDTISASTAKQIAATGGTVTSNIGKTTSSPDINYLITAHEKKLKSEGWMPYASEFKDGEVQTLWKKEIVTTEEKSSSPFLIQPDYSKAPVEGELQPTNTTTTGGAADLGKLVWGAGAAFINYSPLPLEINKEGVGEIKIKPSTVLPILTLFGAKERIEEGFEGGGKLSQRVDGGTRDLVTGLGILGTGTMAMGVAPIVSAVPYFGTAFGTGAMVTTAIGIASTTQPTVRTVSGAFGADLVPYSIQEETAAYASYKLEEQVVKKKSETNIELPFIGSTHGIVHNLVPGAPAWLGDNPQEYKKFAREYLESKGYKGAKLDAYTEQVFAIKGLGGAAGEIGALAPAGLAGEFFGQRSIQNAITKKGLMTGTFTQVQAAAEVGAIAAPRLFVAGAIEAPTLYATQSISRQQTITPEGLVISGLIGGIGASIIGTPLVKWGFTHKNWGKAGMGAVYATNPDEPFGDFAYKIYAKQGGLPEGVKLNVWTNVPTNTSSYSLSSEEQAFKTKLENMSFADRAMYTPTQQEAIAMESGLRKQLNSSIFSQSNTSSQTNGKPKSLYSTLSSIFTSTKSPTQTSTTTKSSTFTPSFTPSTTFTPSQTTSTVFTTTPVPTSTPTFTPTWTPTFTPTTTPTPTPTFTPTWTPTFTPTITATGRGFPMFGLPSSGLGGRGNSRVRRKYYNEVSAAFNVFGGAKSRRRLT